MQNNAFSGLFVGQNIVTLAKVDSTNNYLRKELSKSTPLSEGTVILAEEQFAGRGQLNNKWVTEPGKNLTFSILFVPPFPPERQFLLNKAVSLGINDILYKIIGNQVKIKWPNDIYYNDLKLGGILIENIIRGNSWKSSIVGIGLNVNQSSFPDSLKNVTSLNKILQHDYDLKALLRDICFAIEVRYLQFKEQQFNILNHEYLRRLYRFEEKHFFRFDDSVREGKILDVDEYGLLKVAISDTIRTFSSKEIAYIIQ